MCNIHNKIHNFIRTYTVSHVVTSACLDLTCSLVLGIIRSKCVLSFLFRNSSLGETLVVACAVARYSNSNSAT